MTAPALSTFDQAVEQIMLVTGVDRARAESVARLNFPTLVPRPELVDRQDNVLEKKEQQEIYKLLRGYGFKVWNLSQSRASKQTPGLGDAWCTHKTQPIAFWWESKRQVGGKLSPAQLEMRADCQRCGVQYHSGDRRDAARLLVHLGLARVGDGPCGIVPFHEGRP